jgi:hypothetical protein
MCMRHITSLICGLPGSKILVCLNFIHKLHDFWEKELLNIKCAFLFSLQSLPYISHSKKN